MSEHLLKQKLTDCEKALTAAERERDELKKQNTRLGQALEVALDALDEEAEFADPTKSEETRGAWFKVRHEGRDALKGEGMSTMYSSKVYMLERERNLSDNRREELRGKLRVKEEELANALTERDTLAAKVRDLEWDIDAYRGALGYSVPADHTGKLRDGATPQCGICNSEWHKNLEAKCAEMRDAIKEPVWFCNSAKCTNIDGHDPSCAITKRDHALSSDCGRDYVPRRELDAEKAKVAEYQRVLDILKDDPAAVWTNMLRGMIARPAALDHYEECKTELEAVKSVLKECGQVLDDSSTAGTVYSPLVERIKRALAKAKEALK